MTVPVRQNRFDGGELASLWYARTDSPKHGAGLRVMKNFLPLPYGPAQARPGTRFVAYPKATGTTPGVLPYRLISFVLSDGTAYAIELGNGYMRFIRNGAYVKVGANPYEVQTPFVPQMFPYLKFAQVGNAIVFTYGGQAAGVQAITPYVLRYFSPTNWTLVKQAVEPNLLPDLVTPIVNGGSMTKIIFTWSSTSTYNMGDIVEHNNQVWVSIQDDNDNNEPQATSLYWTGLIDTSHLPITATFAVTATYVNDTTGESAETNVIGTLVYQGPLSLDREATVYANGFAIAPGYSFLYFSFYQGNNNIYGYIGDSPTDGTGNSAAYVFDGTAPDFTRQPPPTPTGLGSFTVNGSPDFPSVVGYVDQRRLFARTAAFPMRWRGSEIGNFLRFDEPIPGNPASDAFDFDLNSEVLEEIRAFVSLRSLLILTGQGEWSARGENGTSIEADSMDQKRQSKWGSSWLDPLVIGNGVLFNTAKSNMVRDLYPMYGLYTDNWVGEDLTAYARHLMDGHTIISWAFQSTPYQVAWAVRDDGVLLSLTYDHDKQISGWARHSTGFADKFESICVVPEPPNDTLYVIVNRGGVRTIEMFEPMVQPTDVRYAGYLDCAVLYDGHNGADFGAPGKTTTVGLSGGTTYGAEDQVVISSNGPIFTAGMVGYQWFVLDPDSNNGGPISIIITGYTDAQHVTGTLNAPLSATQKLMWVTSTTNDWAIAYKGVEPVNPGNMPADNGQAQFPVWDTGTTYAAGALVTFAKQGTTGVWQAILANNSDGQSPVAPGSDFATWKSVSISCRGVSVLADGTTVGQVAYNPGTGVVTLPNPAVVVKVGLSYNCDFEPLDLNMTNLEVRDRFKRIVRAGFEVSKSRGIWAGASFESVLNEWEQSQVTDGAIPPLDTDFVEVLISDGFDKNGRMVLRHFDPLPLTVLGILREVELGGS